ncbi:MAG TPA: polymer-forming cytoskeletal protein [Phycisphaerae bacterium]|nr:polymer-forming cytoskeletal protein [Phycisphaerae bacterium]
MSMFCPNCRKRVILENFKIDTYHAVRLFATCGDVTVTKKGHVSAPVKVGSITIDGTLRGSVQARDKIEIGKTGKLTGDIIARRLVVKDGGMLVGRCRIEPDGNGKPAS